MLPYLHHLASACTVVLCAGPLVAPLAMEMLNSVEEACVPFQRLIEHWPQYGTALGSTLAAVIQETASAVMRQCSLTISPPETLGAHLLTRSRLTRESVLQHRCCRRMVAITSSGVSAQEAAQSTRHTAIRAVAPCHCRKQLRTASKLATGAATASAACCPWDAAAQPSRHSCVSHHARGMPPQARQPMPDHWITRREARPASPRGNPTLLHRRPSSHLHAQQHG